jgi:hypothetical protein
VQRTSAFAEQAAAARVDGAVGRQQAAAMVEQHVRVDRRVVADRERAIGFAVAQRLGDLDDGQPPPTCGC